MNLTVRPVTVRAGHGPRQIAPQVMHALGHNMKRGSFVVAAVAMLLVNCGRNTDDAVQTKKKATVSLDRQGSSAKGRGAMSDLPFLDQYGGQSTDELLALQGKYRTDSIVLAFEEAIMKRPPEAALSYEERVVLAVEALEREVNNGGYSQFFTNSSNEYVPIIVDALYAIGATSGAEITQAAIHTLGISGATTPQSVEAAMRSENDTRTNTLERCDGRYYDEAGDLPTPLLGYIQRNKTKITIR